MSNEKEYENAPADIAAAIEQAEVIPDFLPSPDQLVDLYAAQFPHRP